MTIKIEQIQDTKKKNEFMETVADSYIKFLESNGSRILYNPDERIIWLYDTENNKWNKRVMDRMQNGVPMYTEIFNYVRLHNLFENKYTNTGRLKQEVDKIISILLATNKIAPTIPEDRYHNLENGIYDTKLMKLLPHTSKIFTDYKYNFSVDDSKEFKLENYPKLNRLFTGGLSYDGKNIDEDLMFMIGQMFGTSISSLRYEVMYLLIGLSGTSKSTFMNLLSAFVGRKRSGQSKLETFAGKNENKFATYKAVVGKKINISEEIDDKKLNASNLKTLISETYTEVEAKGVNAIDISYNTRFYGTSNNVLEFDSGVAGIDRRLKYINLTRKIPSNEIDIEIINKIAKDKEEMEGLFLFALQGIKTIIDNKDKQGDNWENGFFQSDMSLDTKREVEEKSRPVTSFLRLLRLKRDNTTSINMKELRTVYMKWAEDEGHYGSANMSQIVFNRQFNEFLMSDLKFTMKEKHEAWKRFNNNTEIKYVGLSIDIDTANSIVIGSDNVIINEEEINF